MGSYVDRSWSWSQRDREVEVEDPDLDDIAADHADPNPLEVGGDDSDAQDHIREVVPTTTIRPISITRIPRYKNFRGSLGLKKKIKKGKY